jgi:hypothetical protein
MAGWNCHETAVCIADMFESARSASAPVLWVVERQ